MHILIVNIHVKPECVDAFEKATLENARNSVQEPGIARFDFIQQADDPTRFMLIEVYRSSDGHEQHKTTPHYAKWRETVADMMAEGRLGVKYNNVFPDDKGW